jgi:hypothetical protein
MLYEVEKHYLKPKKMVAVPARKLLGETAHGGK